MLLIEKENQVSEHCEIKTSDKIEPKIINKNPLPTLEVPVFSSTLTNFHG